MAGTANPTRGLSRLLPHRFCALFAPIGSKTPLPACPIRRTAAPLCPAHKSRHDEHRTSRQANPTRGLIPATTLPLLRTFAPMAAKRHCLRAPYGAQAGLQYTVPRHPPPDGHGKPRPGAYPGHYPAASTHFSRLWRQNAIACAPHTAHKQDCNTQCPDTRRLMATANPTRGLIPATTPPLLRTFRTQRRQNSVACAPIRRPAAPQCPAHKSRP